MIVAHEVSELPTNYLVAWADEDRFNRTMQLAENYEAIVEMLTEEQLQHIADVRAFYEKHFASKK